MWLMHTLTARLKWFNDGDLPVYVIISHRWDEDEYRFEKFVTKDQMCGADIYASEGRIPAEHSLAHELKLPAPSEETKKVHGCCRLAAELGYYWVWLDTCCINQASSAELTEAINSMFTWYSQAALCVAYLADVPDHTADHSQPDSPFRKSDWFRRGWTLQELLAPRIVLFVCSDWKWFGTKATLAHILEQITGIDAAVLTFDKPISEVSIADRMRWAANRGTSRVEDAAYSLQGLFGVNMPTIYGEGAAAFVRLQEEIMKSSPDQTLFAWSNNSRAFSGGLLASSSRAFADTARLRPIKDGEIPFAVQRMSDAIVNDQSGKLIESKTPTFTVTSRGILARMPLVRCKLFSEAAIAVLAVEYSDKVQTSSVGLHLRQLDIEDGLPYYYVDHTDGLVVLPRDTHKFNKFTLLPAGSQQASSSAPTELTAEWNDIYIRNAEVPRAQPVVHLEQTCLVLSHWVLAKLNGQGFSLEDPGAPPTELPHPPLRARTLGGTERNGNAGVTVEQTLDFKYKHNGTVAERFSIRLTGSVSLNPHETSPLECLAGLLAGVSINGDDPLTFKTASMPKDSVCQWKEADCAGSRSFGSSSDRRVRLTFTPWTQEGHWLHMLDIDLLGDEYVALARKYRERNAAAADGDGGDEGGFASSGTPNASQALPTSGFLKQAFEPRCV